MSRKVTQRGAAYFALPVGSIVTRELAAAARKRNDGKPAPRGATALATVARKDAPAKFPRGYKRPSQPTDTSAADAGAVSLSTAPTGAKRTITPEVMPTIVPTLWGPQRIDVGGVSWGIPEDSLVHTMVKARGVWVLHDDELFPLLRISGQVRQLVMPPALAEAAKQKAKNEFWPTL